MFKKILIANRGEIALRVLRACRELGIKTVAIHSDVDENAMHVRMADESICVGPASAQSSYLNIPAIITAATLTDVDAIHPGYGFLSENQRFAEIIEEHNIKFIGPKSEHIKMMGNKIDAKKIMDETGVPTVKGINDLSDKNKIEDFIKKVKYPIIVKAASGGGGKGMRIVTEEDDLNKAINEAKIEAKKSFNDENVYLEKFLIKTSSENYIRREVAIAEIISGDPIKLVGQTLTKSTDPTTLASISEVEPFTRENKQYFKLSLFIGYDDNNYVEGNFDITPSTKSTEKVSIGSS